MSNVKKRRNNCHNLRAIPLDPASVLLQVVQNPKDKRRCGKDGCAAADRCRSTQSMQLSHGFALRPPFAGETTLSGRRWAPVHRGGKLLEVTAKGLVNQDFCSNRTIFEQRRLARQIGAPTQNVRHASASQRRIHRRFRAAAGRVQISMARQNQADFRAEV